MADIAEQICLAIDQIVSKKLESIKYDSTIVATIIDNTYAKEHKYTCSNGSAQFIAFSKDNSYKINDSVQVIIPNNDYDEQKIIIGKYVAKDDKPYVFTQPFETIIDVSSNLIIDNKETISGALLANEDYDLAPGKEMLLWSQVFENGHNNYNRLGLQGQFRSWIASLKPVEGEYGYRLEVLSNIGEIVENSGLISNWIDSYNKIINKKEYDISSLIDKTPDSWFEKVENIDFNKELFKESFINEYNKDKYSENCKNMIYIVLYSNVQITELYLNNKDMYGDPYNFQNFFEQEKVFDISTLGTIFGMNLYFYEKSGSFLDKDQKYIPYKTITGGKLPPNLFTKDPYICLGYDLSGFDKEQAILYTLDGDTYITKDNIDPEINRKTIRLRWLHEFEDGQINVITDASNLENYEIRWYRFKMGVPSADEYSGVYWRAVQPSEQSKFSYSFIPDVNVAEEQIKAIVLYNNQVIRSNIIRFTNEIEVISSATIDAIAGLSIWCNDNSYGNYVRYGQNNNLMETDNFNTNRVLTFEARFADQTLLAEEYDIDKQATLLTEAKEIIWEFPLNYSMIVVNGFDYNYDKEIEEDENGSKYKLPGYYNDAIIKVRGNSIYIIRNSKEDGSIVATQDYRIKKTYNATNLNNTVKCTIKKDSLIYSASKELTFGIMGTNGTDATVVIDFDNNKTALTADLDNETLKVTAHLYDSNHNEVDFNNTDLGLSCEWSWLYKEIVDGEDISLTYRDDQNNDIPKNTCYLSHNKKLSIDSNKFFLVLQATIKGWGDYDLVSYKAIPIRATSQYRNIIGPTEIIYNSTGYPDYYKDPFQIWKSENVNESDIAEDEIIQLDNAKWNIYNPLEEEAVYLGEISEKNILKPAPIYVKDLKPYGATCQINNQIVWIQPFVILQNQYPSSTLNKWDGKSIELNENEGYIVAPAIAAGKKDSDNKFSGIMLGDWSNTNAADDITKQTGIYGFHKGAVSFAFKEDGTGFIGKSGLGRINFNGDSSRITSNRFEKELGGLMLDFDDGLIEMRNPLLSEKKGTIKFDASARTYPFTIGANFKIDWDGSLVASNGNFNGIITSDEGYIGGWVIEEHALSSENGNIILNSDEGSITGGIIRGSSSQPNVPNNVMFLDGYFSLQEEPNARIGKIRSNFPDHSDDGIGVGVFYISNSAESFLKATESNAGLTYSNNKGGGYITINDGGKIVIGSDSGIEFSNIPANQQWGIYARFA